MNTLENILNEVREQTKEKIDEWKGEEIAESIKLYLKDLQKKENTIEHAMLIAKISTLRQLGIITNETYEKLDNIIYQIYVEKIPFDL